MRFKYEIYMRSVFVCLRSICVCIRLNFVRFNCLYCVYCSLSVVFIHHHSYLGWWYLGMNQSSSSSAAAAVASVSTMLLDGAAAAAANAVRSVRWQATSRPAKQRLLLRQKICHCYHHRRRRHRRL